MRDLATKSMPGSACIRLVFCWSKGCLQMQRREGQFEPSAQHCKAVGLCIRLQERTVMQHALLQGTRCCRQKPHKPNHFHKWALQLPAWFTGPTNVRKRT
jgi:hypothetical protein